MHAVRGRGNIAGISQRSVTKGTCITSPVKKKKKKPKKTHAGPLLTTGELTVPRNQTWSYVNNFDICASARSCQRKFSPKNHTHTPTLRGRAVKAVRVGDGDGESSLPAASTPPGTVTLKSIRCRAQSGAPGRCYTWG